MSLLNCIKVKRNVQNEKYNMHAPQWVLFKFKLHTPISEKKIIHNVKYYFKQLKDQTNKQI